MNTREPLPVYIVHWNAPDWARSTVDSFVSSSIPVAVTVIDNGPYDDQLEVDARANVVRSGANLGYAGGANVGIERWLEGPSDLCVVACHDVRLDRDALASLVGAANAHPEYGVLAPQPVQGVVSGPVLARTDSLVDVAWASGTCLLLRRACIEQVGSFDSAFGSYGEDIDLCYRAGDAGWKVGLVCAAHARGAGSVNPKFRTQMYVNQVRLRLKRAGARKATRMLAAFPVLAARDALRWPFVHDPMLLNRARSRLGATPAAARLIAGSLRDRQR
jgi:GT2 family glycosyltransferase